MIRHLIASTALLCYATVCYAQTDTTHLSPAIRALSVAKSRIADGDPSFRPALEQLAKDAKSAMKAGPFSVMNKTSIPPSGDKHDYMSLGSYWWPDPKKPDGLPYIRHDGRRNPKTGSDKYDRAELGNMEGTVYTLALAYYLTGKESCANRAAVLLRTWFIDDTTKMNPNLEYAQSIPGRTKGRDIGIIDTVSLLPVVDAVDMIDSSPSWTERDRRQITDWFGQYLNWLLTSKNGRSEGKRFNNHGTWYDVQVARYALFVGKLDLARHVLEASKTKRIESQIEPDGRQPEELARTKTFSYSAMNLRGMITLAKLGDRLGIDLAHYTSKDGRGIRAAIDFIAPYADPKLKWPYKQITSFDRLSLAPILCYAATVYRSADYRQYIDKLPHDRLVASRIKFYYPDVVK